MDVLYHLKHLLHHRRSKPERGFIDQQQARTGHQRAPDGHHLLLSARERPGGLPAALLQDGKHAVDHRQAFFAEGPRRLAITTHIEVLFHRHAAKQLAALRDQRHLAIAHFARGQLCRILAAKQ